MTFGKEERHKQSFSTAHRELSSQSVTGQNAPVQGGSSWSSLSSRSNFVPETMVPRGRIWAGRWPKRFWPQIWEFWVEGQEWTGTPSCRTQWIIRFKPRWRHFQWVQTELISAVEKGCVLRSVIETSSSSAHFLNWSILLTHPVQGNYCKSGLDS